MHQQVYHSPVYLSQTIQAWEQRWFAKQNSSYALMQQVAWMISQRLVPILKQRQIQNIAVCCGQGNNAGDGYLSAKYLKQFGFDVDIYAAELGASTNLHTAYQEAVDAEIKIYAGFEFQKQYDCYIDALFGIGLNRELSADWQKIIQGINAQTGLKIAIDIPSGLHANTGQPLPCAMKADYCYSVLGFKAGLFTGQGKEFAGQVEVISMIPTDVELEPIAQLSPDIISLPERQAFGQAIANFQNTRFVLAQAKIDELATAAFYNQNVALYNEGKLDVETAAALKSFSTDMQMKVADNLLQLFGGYGYMTEYPISRFFVDARIQRIYGGTNEIMKEIVARGLIGKA